MTNHDLQLDVATELSWDPKVGSQAIAVSADDGAVTLRGTVGSFREKRKRERQPRARTGHRGQERTAGADARPRA
jgi:osmotically-inducible protein OsmY